MRKLLISISIALFMQYAYPMKCCPYCSKEMELPQEAPASSEPSVFSVITIDRSAIPIGNGTFGVVYPTNLKDWVVKVRMLVAKSKKYSDMFETEVENFNEFYDEYDPQLPKAFIKEIPGKEEGLFMPNVGKSILDIHRDYERGTDLVTFKELQQAVKDGQLDHILQTIKKTIGAHGDIKANNLTYNRGTGRIYLIDFFSSLYHDDSEEIEYLKTAILNTK